MGKKSKASEEKTKRCQPYTNDRIEKYTSNRGKKYQKTLLAGHYKE